MNNSINHHSSENSSKEFNYKAYRNDLLTLYMDNFIERPSSKTLFGFEHEFKSATDMYKTGQLDEYLLKAFANYDQITGLMLPTSAYAHI